MSNLEPRIEAVRQKYGLERSDFWQIKQNGQWVCKHAALEIVAAKANVEWLPPLIIEKDAPNLVTSMVVTGKMGERVEWATGETNATNYKVTGKQSAYPWAMSEKRAKDRVVLKLVGIHGLVYSEDEMGDDAKPTAREDRPQVDEAMESLWSELTQLRSAEGLKSFWIDNSKAIAGFDDVNRARFTKKKDEMKARFDTDQTVADIQDTFPGAKVVDVRRIEDMSNLEAGE
jgi:hypothetical protein